MEQPDRRASSSAKEQNEIERLIATEDDPKVRLQLMVMNRINLSLIANTQTINDVASRLDEHLTNFETHAKNEEEAINKGKGAWKVIGIVAIVVQIVIVGLWNDVRSEIQNSNTLSETQRIAFATLDKRVVMLEAKQDLAERKK